MLIAFLLLSKPSFLFNFKGYKGYSLNLIVSIVYNITQLTDAIR